MLSPDKLTAGDILAMDRAYIDYGKFEQMTKRGVIYVTKMKQNLTYETLKSTYYMNGKGQMQWREEYVVFRKEVKVKETGEDGKETVSTRTIEHKARIVTYADEKNRKLVRLLTNDLEMPYEDIVAIYKKRWAIESLFKQMKQNFPLRYFYGESANAIKTQIWVTLIANLLLTLLQKGVTHAWSFSGLATMVRIMLMYYIDVMGFLEHPEKDWEVAIEEAISSPPATE
jgi:IS4 transposase